MAKINYENARSLGHRDDVHIPAKAREGTFCGADCSCGHGHGEEKGDRLLLIRICISAALFLTNILFPVAAALKILLYSLSLLVAGYDILLSALKNIASLRLFDENLLMSIAAVCSFAIGEYPEGAAVILLFRVGELLEDRAIGNSRKSIAGLVKLKPDTATVIREGRELTLSAQSVCAGDIILIRPGERVPLDGEIISGDTSLDTSAVTGESMPRSAVVGDRVLSGSTNLDGVIKLRVEAPFSESTVSRILELVENANRNKAKPEKFIRRFARIYTPAVILAAVLAIFIPTVLLGLPFKEWLQRALIFLVISCPCALVISVPLTYFAGIGGATKRGILFKGSASMDGMAEASAIVFDKTGTLTTGKFIVTEVESEVVSKDKLTMLAAHAEYYSKHPLAKAIVEAYSGRIDRDGISDFRETRGKGVSARVGGTEVLAGTADLLREAGILIGGGSTDGSAVYVAADGKYLGRIILSDTQKEDAEITIKALRRLGIPRIAMMTGDRGRAAVKIASAVGISEVYSEYLPEDKSKKLAEIMREQKNGGKTVFVGDGINDTPVLSSADVGISMGGLGSDAAIEASDVVIMNDRLLETASAVRIAKATRKIVRQNIVMALAFKFAAMILGLFGYVPMWLAVFADVGVAFLSIINAMRAYKIKNDVN